MSHCSKNANCKQAVCATCSTCSAHTCTCSVPATKRRGRPSANPQSVSGVKRPAPEPISEPARKKIERACKDNSASYVAGVDFPLVTLSKSTREIDVMKRVEALELKTAGLPGQDTRELRKLLGMSWESIPERLIYLLKQRYARMFRLC
jgi:hypothetical protein